MTALPQIDMTPVERKPISPVVQNAYGFTNYVYFDIETIPDQRDGVLDKYREQVTAPASFKKPESIDAWLAENRERAAHEMLAKTSFDGGSGHVCTIGWAINDGEIHVEHAESIGEERDILSAFFKAMPKRDATIVGHNILGFDVPFLLKRAVVLGVELPSDYVFPRDPKPWSKGVFDTMTAWAGARDMISMNRLCGILGIIGKEDFDGSMVADAWAAGDHITIAHYCHDDVSRTRAIHHKFLEAGF